jgi:uncharacterized repeat protein (TIGR03803 family)
MSDLSCWNKACAVFVLCAASAIAARAQTFRTLVNFDGKDGDNPELMSLVQGTDGNLYGMTVGGGNRPCSPQNYGCGTIFRITPQGNLTTLYRFCSLTGCTDGSFPSAPLVLATDGSFYGTTNGGGNMTCNSNYGCGTVFKITPRGVLITLYTFDYVSGSSSNGGLIQAVGGDFYGTTGRGGTDGYGTVFKITAAGALTTLHNFTGSDGAYPYGDLVQGTDGNFYGTTEGFPLSYGTIFKITPSGEIRTLPLNLTDGIYPCAGLIQALDGNLYGTTYAGGADNCDGGCGTIFKVTPEGSLTVLYSFCAQPDCADGYQLQAPLVQATDGNFYGTTRQGANPNCYEGCGTVFQITPAGVLTTLHSFDGTDGSSSLDGLLQATNGIFYGATSLGGNFCTPEYCGGTIYSLDMGLGPFVTFISTAGKVGQTGGILGQGFTGTTNVSLNGTPESFTVVSDTYLRATVPVGATTGYVTVTTPSGTLTSNVPFHVIP